MTFAGLLRARLVAVVDRDNSANGSKQRTCASYCGERLEAPALALQSQKLVVMPALRQAAHSNTFRFRVPMSNRRTSSAILPRYSFSIYILNRKKCRSQESFPLCNRYLRPGRCWARDGLLGGRVGAAQPNPRASVLVGVNELNTGVF